MPGNIVPRDELKVKINGSELTQDQQTKIGRVILDSSLAVPDMFELHVQDLKDDEVDTFIFNIGDACDISLSGENSNIQKIMDGVITAVEPVFEGNIVHVMIRGYDKSYKMHQGAKSKAWLNIKDSDLAQQIASANGLQAEVDATSTVYDHIFQDAQSDFDFLTQRAERIGYTVFTENGKLHFSKAAAPSSAEVTLTFRENLISFRPRLSASGQVGEVKVRGWDPKEKKEIMGSASSSQVDAEIGIGKTGSQIGNSLGAAPRLFVRQNVVDQSDATTIAQALLNQSSGRFIEAEGEVEGLPTLKAGMVVEIKKVASKFCGKYRLTSVRHEFTAGVYKSFFRIEGAQPAMITSIMRETKAENQPWSSVVSALVTNNNDPEDMGRVKLKYPWLSDSEESFWARVLVLGGGKERGVYFLPEVNDEVLVAFEQGDFNRPYVLGGLQNGKDAPSGDIGSVVKSGAVVQRIIRTRTGHTITISDEDGKEYIEIKDSKKNTSIMMDTTNKKITMDSQGEISITASSNISLLSQSGNITIEASAGDVQIKGINIKENAQANIDIQAQANASMQATSMATVKGTASAELSSAGQTAVKGSLVMIN